MLIELPRRWVLALAIAALLLGVLGVGYQNSPRGSDARPVLLSPSVRALERYRGSLLGWVRAYQALSTNLAHILEDERDLLATSQAAQQAFETALALGQAIDAADPPTALVGTQTQASQTAQAFIEASLAVAAWVTAPSPDNKTTAQQALKRARSLLMELEQNHLVASSG
jgi:hypothetical protein